MTNKISPAALKARIGEDEELAILDLQIQTIHGDLVAVVLSDPFELDHAARNQSGNSSSLLP